MGHGSSPVCPQLSSSRTSLVASTLPGGGTEQEEQCQHSGTRRGREKHLQFAKGVVLGRTWPEQLDQQVQHRPATYAPSQPLTALLQDCSSDQHLSSGTPDC
ncbi:hypothetical protein DV515_00010859 [Chloebia gouldiae]|uniref:Uncharacterized protein n=1 Tax=Chloebia gouldiae TaxID=44316 RepID=A0A3L8S990_CHLGU|nr:hypothetical protein DV515_00010859 [Chloebia gouldiae]